MTQEIKDKLKQAAAEKYPISGGLVINSIKRGVFIAGAETILDNPKEWGLVSKDEVNKANSKWAKAYSHNDQEKNTALMNCINDIEILQTENTRLREALESIISYEDRGMAKGEPRISETWYNKAKEALKNNEG